MWLGPPTAFVPSVVQCNGTPAHSRTAGCPSKSLAKRGDGFLTKKKKEKEVLDLFPSPAHWSSWGRSFQPFPGVPAHGKGLRVSKDSPDQRALTDSLQKWRPLFDSGGVVLKTSNGKARKLRLEPNSEEKKRMDLAKLVGSFFWAPQKWWLSFWFPF